MDEPFEQSQSQTQSQSQKQTQALETGIKNLENEVLRLRMWIEKVYSNPHLGIAKPSLSNIEILAGADPFLVDPALQKLIQQGDINGVAECSSDLTGVLFPDAKSAVKKQFEQQ